MDWYTLRVAFIDPASIPDGLRVTLSVLEYHQEPFAGAHFKIGGLDKAAYLDSRELAEQYTEACRGVFEKRYGSNVVDLKVLPMSSGPSLRSEKSDRERMEADSQMVRARLEQRVYAPNKRPEL